MQSNLFNPTITHKGMGGTERKYGEPSHTKSHFFLLDKYLNRNYTLISISQNFTTSQFVCELKAYKQDQKSTRCDGSNVIYSRDVKHSLKCSKF